MDLMKEFNNFLLSIRPKDDYIGTAKNEAIKFAIYEGIRSGITYVYKNFFSTRSKAEDTLTKIAKTAQALIPDGKLDDSIGKFIEISSKVGLENYSKQMVNDCANQEKIDYDNAKNILHCLKQAIKEDSGAEMMMRFIGCHPMTPVEAFGIMSKATDFAQCLGGELKETFDDN